MRSVLIGFCLSLITSTAFASDVYFCQGKTLTDVNNNVVKEYKPQNFKFYATKTELRFGSGGYFDDTVMPISDYITDVYWYAQDKYSIAFFDAPKFHFTGISLNGGIIITASCDKF